MMSNPTSHYKSSYPHPDSNLASQDRNGYGMQLAGLDALAEGSQYALDRLQRTSVSNNHYVNLNRSSNPQRSHSFSLEDELLHRQRSNSTTDGPRVRKSNNPVRRRISRACDQCNQLRTKCDGKAPCQHCVDFNLTCEYARERKKRGKASKKDLAAAQSAAHTVVPSTSKHEDELNSPNGAESSGGSPTPDLSEIPDFEKSNSVSRVHGGARPSPSRSMSMNDGRPTDVHIQRHTPTINRANSFGTVPELAQFHDSLEESQPPDGVQHGYENPMSGIGIGSYETMHGIDRAAMHGSHLNGIPLISQVTQSQGPNGLMESPNFPHFNDSTYGMINSPNQQRAVSGYRYGNPAESPAAPFAGFSPHNASPGWASLPSPGSNASNQAFPLPRPLTGLKYPVLGPLLPHLGGIIPPALAGDLLEVYFASSSSAQLRPLSPYVLGYVFRKKSILSQSKPRHCSPALLASMLWIAAQTHEAPFLTSPPSARGRVCQRLLELTISLLRPLVHGPTTGETHPNYASTMVINGVALGGFGVSVDHVSAETSATGAVDDVATYIHLATVVSASEYKAASLRWWNAAWSLARELKLGRELAVNQPTSLQNGNEMTINDGLDDHGKRHLQTDQNQQTNGMMDGRTPHDAFNEEEREERRRIWWLLYTMDRHLALCYNRPLFLLDKECDGLYQPMSDRLFQSGDFLNPDYRPKRPRRRGLTFECTGHSIFGYFLPLMSILGEIVDLHHARNHPKFGLGFRNSSEWDTHAREISNQLDTYGQSLRDFELQQTSKMTGAQNNDQDQSIAVIKDQNTPSVASTNSHMTESVYQTRIVVAYGTHIMHVLHILLTGKWDPISLLDDNDLWISSESFITATSHAVNAAEAISDILEYDPDLSFMPFFFGVYLLQGSFLLLLIADKLQGEASPSVVKACETIVRAHEACVVTLNTEYQRNFRKVMRSALMQVKGRIPEDFGEQQQRRREVLALYRWSGDGTGLAL